MALSIILRRSASRVIGGGNRCYANLILPGASVPWLRQFCSSPCLSPKDNESLAVGDAKRLCLDESLVNQLMSQVQSLQRDIESLRKSYSKPGDESVVEGQGIDESQSIHKGVDDDDSSPKGSGDGACNVSESNESDDDSNNEGKDSDVDDSSEDDNNKSSSESDNESASECDDKSLPKSKENEQLLKGIQQEILRAKNFMELSAPDAAIPVDFPFSIKQDYCGISSIVLSREYQGELVEVTVENPTLFTDSQHRNDYNETKSCSFSMDLTVVVTSLSSESKEIELKCGARPEGISIYAAKDPADGFYNQGVSMSEFHENLKEEFGKYLEARGITRSTTNFLYKYMLDKANKERLRILENIQKMVA